MANFQLSAVKREKFGSSEAKKIKKSGKFPAVIQSKAENLNISLEKREFEIELKKGNIQTRVAEIEIDGKKIKAIVSRIELDPVSDQVIHVDFVNCQGEESLKAWPKVTFRNREKSPGIRRGGFLNVRARKIEVICENEAAIPETIEIDIAKMQVGDKIRSSQVKLPDGASYSAKSEFLIASITGRGKAEAEEAATASEAEGSEAATDAEKTEEKKD